MDSLTRVQWMYGRTFSDPDRARTWLRRNGYTPDPEEHGRVPARYLSDNIVAHLVFCEGMSGAPDTWSVVCYRGLTEDFDTGTDWDDEE